MTVQTIDAQTAHNWLSAGEAVLIDVREADEFKAGHIPYALSLPLSSLGANLALPVFSGGTKVIFQCQKGKRGEQACVMAGSTPHSYNLEGGVENWAASGLPLVGGNTSSLTIFRQVQMIVGFLVFLCTALGLAGIYPAFYVAGLLGFALMSAGITGWCGLAMLLAKMPWNRA
ncbi:MAG: rhodanese-like domain-containing protein [Alphaproteobacteria bacterium]|nr:rhodanese-like domain-containing protein [Alphaproteobacteria bacterium]MCD8519881.1 rhodanese-like domain-containing protein [Alphaproteobacteria bacterium]MCD8525741.1 rhodanese-like domain-containing protein [Alphaproteobacteria bacterium]MCD8571004.1 rhodanese-like domain-containing protein [Alphaproteobacteria bacterium]